MKNLHSMSLTVLFAFTLSSCATANKSVGVGAVAGALGGAAIGGIADPGHNGEYRTRNVIIGAGLGAMAGAVAGSLIHRQMEEEKAKAFEQGKGTTAPPESSTQPKLTEPKVEAHFIEGKAQGNRYIGPHWEYILIEPARWKEGQ